MSPREIFTDGSCKGPRDDRRAAASIWIPEIGRGLVSIVPGRQTNQRAELYAIVLSLQKISGALKIYTDSDYSIKCFTVWWKNWVKNGWKNTKQKSVENRDLIEAGLKLLETRTVQFVHVRGHQCGNSYEIAGNNKSDEIAQSYADGFLTSSVEEVIEGKELQLDLKVSQDLEDDDPWACFD